MHSTAGWFTKGNVVKWGFWVVSVSNYIASSSLRCYAKPLYAVQLSTMIETSSRFDGIFLSRCCAVPLSTPSTRMGICGSSHRRC